MSSVTSITAETLAALLEQTGSSGNNKEMNLESFGYFLDDYVISGADITLEPANPKRFYVNEGILSFSDGLYRVYSDTFNVNAKNAKYFIDFTVNAGFIMNTSHPATDLYLPLWEVNTDASGRISSTVDKRGEIGFLRFRSEIQGVITNSVIVDESHITNQAVGTTKIKDGSVIEVKMADDSISSRTIQDNAITQAHLADNAVGTAEIINQNVTEPKLADDSVSTRVIQDDTVTHEQIKGKVSESKLQLDYPSGGIAERVRQLEQNPAGIFEVTAARGGYASLSDRLAAIDIGLTLNNQSFVAIQGQTVFTLTSGTYVPGTKRMNVFVGGAFQKSGTNYTESSATTITLSEAVDVGVQVDLSWYEGKIPVTSGHGKAHKLGGYDELNIADLAGFASMDSIVNENATNITTNTNSITALKADTTNLKNRAFIVNEADVQLLQSKLKTGEGIIYATLGDSTEDGVGNGADVYAETNSINLFSGQTLFALSLMRSDDNFLPPDPSVYAVAEPMTAEVPVIVESHKLVKSVSPTLTYTCKQKGAVKYDKLTVYYLERTADTAAKFDIVTNSMTTTIDTYVSPANYLSTNIPINPRMKKATVTILAQTDFTFTLNNVVVVDRGNGLAADGTAVVLGFALGNGVDFINYAISSTTLLNNSAANVSRGITTDQMLNKAYAKAANVISMGWGTNDSKVGVSTVSAFKTDLKTRIDQIRAQNPKTIIILNTDPRGAVGSIYENNPAYNAAIREVALEKNVNCLDVEYLFDNLNSLVYSDTVHPSAKGYYTLGKSLAAMFNIAFAYPREKTFVTVSSASNPDADPGQMFNELILTNGSSDFSNALVSMGSITMARPTGKYNVRVTAQLNLAQAGIINSQFQLEVTGYSDAAGTTPIAPTDIVLTKKTFLDNGTDTANGSETRITEAVLEGFRKFSTAKAVKVVLKGKNYQLRSADAQSEIRIMFW